MEDSSYDFIEELDWKNAGTILDEYGDGIAEGEDDERVEPEEVEYDTEYSKDAEKSEDKKEVVAKLRPKPAWSEAKAVIFRSGHMTGHEYDENLIELPEITYQDITGNDEKNDHGLSIGLFYGLMKDEKYNNLQDYDIVFIDCLDWIVTKFSFRYYGVDRVTRTEKEDDDVKNKLRDRLKKGAARIRVMNNRLMSENPNLKIIWTVPHPINYTNVDVGFDGDAKMDVGSYKTHISIIQYFTILGVIKRWLKTMPYIRFVCLADLVISKEDSASFLNGKANLRWTEEVKGSRIGLGYSTHLESKIWEEIRTLYEMDNDSIAKYQKNRHKDLVKRCQPETRCKKNGYFRKEKEAFLKKRRESIKEMEMSPILFSCEEEFYHYWDKEGREKYGQIVQNEEKPYWEPYNKRQRINNGQYDHNSGNTYNQNFGRQNNYNNRGRSKQNMNYGRQHGSGQQFSNNDDYHQDSFPHQPSVANNAKPKPLMSLFTENVDDSWNSNSSASHRNAFPPPPGRFPNTGNGPRQFCPEPHQNSFNRLEQYPNTFNGPRPLNPNPPQNFNRPSVPFLNPDDASRSLPNFFNQPLGQSLNAQNSFNQTLGPFHGPSPQCLQNSFPCNPAPFSNIKQDPRPAHPTSGQNLFTSNQTPFSNTEKDKGPPFQPVSVKSEKNDCSPFLYISTLLDTPSYRGALKNPLIQLRNEASYLESQNRDSVAVFQKKDNIYLIEHCLEEIKLMLSGNMSVDERSKLEPALRAFQSLLWKARNLNKESLADNTTGGGWFAGNRAPSNMDRTWQNQPRNNSTTNNRNENSSSHLGSLRGNMLMNNF